MKKLNEPLIIKIFLIIYLFFSIGLIYYFFNSSFSNIKDTLKYLLVLVISIFLVWLFRNKEIKLKKSYWLFLMIAIIIHLGLLFINYNYPEGDCGTYYNNALSFALYGNYNNSKYMAVFPHLNGYVILLGFIMRFITTKYISFISLNLIFEFLGAFIIYKLFSKRNNKNLGKLASLAWLLNPINIIWCSLCIPIIVFQTLFLLSIYMFEEVLRRKNNQKSFLLFSFLTGIVVGFSNLFRPIMIIYLIAIFLYYIYTLLIAKDKKYFIYLISLILIFVPYIVINKVNNYYVEKISNYETSSIPGWNIYVGSTEDNGMWNSKAGAEFNKLLNDETTTVEDIHEYFLNKGIENYQKRGFNNISFFNRKFKALTTNINGLTARRVRVQIKNVSKNVSKNVDNLVIIWHGLCLIFALASILKYIKSNQNKIILFYSLLTIGITLAFMFLEVSPRYFIPVFVPLLLLSLSYFEKNYK